MPGPRNPKKKLKAQQKKEKLKSRPRGESLDDSGSATTSSHPATPACPIVIPYYSSKEPEMTLEPEPEPEHFGSCYYETRESESTVLPQQPYIHDPGNGPRVRDTRIFLSSYFAQPPSLDSPLCAEFAQPEILQMLSTVLPQETALILWYNKSRRTSRICPACQRLYRLGDILPDHMHEEALLRDESRTPPWQLAREQELSGLCSPVCFVLAAFARPGAIRSAWGRTADEMEENTWESLNAPLEGKRVGKNGDEGLGMLLRMTRLEDLGLAQLCLPDLDLEEEKRWDGWDGREEHAFA